VTALARAWTWWLVALVCLSGVARSAAPVEDTPLERGSVLYRLGDFDGAEATWREAYAAATSAAERARLAYNLGNAAYRREAPLQAVAWYTQCLQHAPRHGAARTNLKLARAEAGLPPDDAGSLGGTLVRAVGVFDAAEATWLALLGVALFAATLVFEALRGGAVGRLVVVLGAFALLVAFGPLLVRAARPSGERAVVIADKDLAGRSEPRSEAKRLGTIAAGAVVSITDRYLDWTRVRAEEGEFWVPDEALFALR
jgi:tetratricopeptide (TPR) repeat protein